MQEQINAGERIVSGLLERIKGSANAEVVFGEPRTVGEKTIIPIAVVTYGFGGGGGGGEARRSDGERPAVGGGGGGGGGVRVQPVAVLEVGAASSKMVPIVDWTRIAMRAIAFLGLWMLVRAWRKR